MEVIEVLKCATLVSKSKLVDKQLTYYKTT